MGHRPRYVDRVPAALGLGNIDAHSIGDTAGPLNARRAAPTHPKQRNSRRDQSLVVYGNQEVSGTYTGCMSNATLMNVLKYPVELPGNGTAL
jgi:hypothetical protein